MREPKDLDFYTGILLTLEIALTDFDGVLMSEVILQTIDARACLRVAKYLNWEPGVVLYIERHILNRQQVVEAAI